jgi:hypothetical protein
VRRPANSTSYLGYVLRVQGRVGGTSREFLVAIGPKTHERLQFAPGGQAGGDAEWCPDPERTGVDLHKAAHLSFVAGAQPSQEPPPWTGPPPALSVYRARGHRRLAAQRYASHCWRCQWGARMPAHIGGRTNRPARSAFALERPPRVGRVSAAAQRGG